MPENSEENRLNLRSEEVQEILTKPPVWIVRWGITLVFGFTCLIIFLSYIIEYPDYLSAKIIVTTRQPTEKVIARYPGQIEKIFIKNRDTVHIGQQLAIIKNTANYEHVFRLKAILDTLHFKLNDFSFPIDSVSNFILGDIEPAYIEFEKSYVEYFLLQGLEPYDNQLTGNREALKEVKKRLENQIAQKGLLEQKAVLAKSEFNRYTGLYDKGVISSQEFETKEIEYIQMQEHINNMAISISQMREAIATANQTLKDTYINKQEDDTRFLKNLIQSYNSLKRAVRDWEYNYVLSSSINGVISFQNFWGVNQNVNNGDIVFSILPEDKSVLVGKMTLASQNAGKVNIDQKVLVKLDNYPYQQYGMLVGKVKNISISLDDQGNYIVYTELPDGTLTSYHQEIEFNQELIGSAEIITEDLSVAERLFYKMRGVFQR
ncbi:HlyD family secretion protein [Sinomicrobium sp. M5D2P9]